MEVNIHITSEILELISKIDEFKGRWEALGNISRDHLSQLRRTATIENVGSSTRIEGAKLSDHEVEKLLARIEIQKFKNLDEQEVARYAKAMGVKVISLIAQHDALSNRELVTLTDSNSNTMKSILSKLTKEGFILREGSGRATRYRLSK